MSIIYSDQFWDNSDTGRMIADIVRIHSLDICEHIIDDSSDDYTSYHNCLLKCLQFHAKQVGQADVVDLEKVIQALQEERSLLDKTAMGGNPLRDCVLAIAMILKDSQAVNVFENDYFIYLKGVAFQVRKHFGNDPHDWWNEFLDFLAGYTHSNGKLKKYQGKSVLKYWLRIVLWNFLLRRPISMDTMEFLEDVSIPQMVSGELELNDSISIFAEVIQNAVSSLSEKDRLFLAMIYIDKLLKKDIAAIFRVHPAQIGRWQETALEHFRSAILIHFENFSDKDMYEEIIEGIVNNPKKFSEVLITVLQQLRPNDFER